MPLPEKLPALAGRVITVALRVRCKKWSRLGYRLCECVDLGQLVGRE